MHPTRDASQGPTVIFLDEIDALATSRDDAGMHEASRRSLSVLLRKLDGFEGNKTTVLIAATNRPQVHAHATTHGTYVVRCPPGRES